MNPTREEQAVVDKALSVGEQVKLTKTGTEEDIGTINLGIDVLTTWASICHIGCTEEEQRQIKTAKTRLEEYQYFAYHTVFSQR